MRRKLNKQIVASTSPQDREIIIWDTDIPGLGLRVTPGGAKSFILKTRIGGGRSAPIKKPTLGKVGDLTLDGLLPWYKMPAVSAAGANKKEKY